MKNRKRKIRNLLRAVCFGTAVCLALTSCSLSEYPKTILLDDKADSPAPVEPGAFRYEMKKMYQQETVRLHIPSASAVEWTPTGDNRLVRVSQGEEGELIFNTVDYRYGFYEPLASFSGDEFSSYSLSPGGQWVVLKKAAVGQPSSLLLRSLNLNEEAETLHSLNTSSSADLSLTAFWSPNGRYFATIDWGDETWGLPGEGDRGTLYVYDCQEKILLNRRSVYAPRTDYRGVLSNDGQYLFAASMIEKDDNAYFWFTSEPTEMTEPDPNTAPGLLSFDAPVRSIAYTEREGIPTFLYTTPQMIGQVTITNSVLEMSRLKSVPRPREIAVTADGTAVAYLKETGSGKADIYLSALAADGLSEGSLLYKEVDLQTSLCFGSHDRCLLAETVSGNLSYDMGLAAEGGTAKWGWLSSSLVIELQ